MQLEFRISGVNTALLPAKLMFRLSDFEFEFPGEPLTFGIWHTKFRTLKVK